MMGQLLAPYALIFGPLADRVFYPPIHHAALPKGWPCVLP